MKRPFVECDGGDHGRYCDPCSTFECEDCRGAICQDACFHTNEDLIVCHVCASFEDGNHASIAIQHEKKISCEKCKVELHNALYYSNDKMKALANVLARRN